MVDLRTSKDPGKSDLLSSAEAAELMKCHPNTLRARIRRGLLTPVYLEESKVPFFRKSDVLAFLEKGRRTAPDDFPVHTDPFPVVAISSTSSTADRLSEVIEGLRTDLGMAYIVVADDADEESLRRITRNCPMPVSPVSEGLQLEPDRLYILPAGTRSIVMDRRFKRISAAAKENSSITDRLYRSLAAEYRSNVVVVLFNGDHTAMPGARQIRDEGGVVIAIEPLPGDGNGSIKDPMADIILSPDRVGTALAGLHKHFFKEADASQGESDLRRILILIHQHRGVDFELYKPATVHRRIYRRMALSHCSDLGAYYRLLRENKTEVDTLYNDLLINVTSFFRDPDVFRALSRKIFPALLKGRSLGAPLRIWVPGCSGGEEVVSIAITLLEYLGDRALTTPVQIFATDLNEQAIERARLGIYKRSAVAGISSRRLKKFFTEIDGHYQVVRSIRDMCVFARHDLVKDPPFSNVDLISCQNLLIYLEQTAQGRIMRSFHYALRPNGYLILGRSETPSAGGDIFVEGDRQYKFYRPKEGADRKVGIDHVSIPGPVGSEHFEVVPGRIDRSSRNAEVDLDRELDRSLLQRLTPPCVVVNRSNRIVRFRGDTTRFLEHGSGKPTLDLLKLLRTDLVFEVRSLLRRAAKERIPMQRKGIPSASRDRATEVDLEVVPLGNEKDPHFMVLFRESEPLIGKGRQGRSEGDHKERRVKALEQELQDLREQMRMIAREYETATAELQSANEEVVSSNEELQSINEELETSKEELQSINEEFITINEELQQRNDELRESEVRLKESEARYKQLVDIMPVGIHVCDADGRSLLFNRSAEKIWGRKPAIGRDRWCGAFRSRNADGSETRPEESPLAQVLRTGEAMKEVEVIMERPDGELRYVIASPAPLFDHEGAVTGALNVLIDITDRRKVNAEKQRLSNVLEKSLNEIYMFDLRTLKFEYVNRGALKNLGYTLEQMRQMTPLDIKPEFEHDDFDRLVAPLRDGSEHKLIFHTVHRRADGSDYPVEVHLQLVDSDQGKVFLALILDITEQRVNEERLRVATQTGKLGIWDWDIQNNSIEWTDPVYGIHGVKKGDFEPTLPGYVQLIHPEDRDRVEKAINAAVERDLPYEIEFRTLNPAGEVNWVFTSGVVLREKDRPVRMIGGTMNITGRKKAEEDAQQLAAIVESSQDAIFSTDLQGNITSWNKASERIYGYAEAEAIGRNISMLLPAGSGSHGDLLEMIGSGIPIAPFEGKRLRKDGTLVDLAITISPVVAADGTLIGISKIAHDISDRKRVEAERREMQEKFQLLADNMDQLAWIAAADGSTMWFNKRWEEFSGIPVDQIRERAKDELHHPEHYERVVGTLGASAAKGEPWECVFPMKSRTGEWRWFLSRAVPLRNEEGAIHRWFGTSTDITESRKAQEAVRESEEWFRMLTDHMDQLAWVGDRNGRTIWMNRRWYQFTGLELDEIRQDGGSRIYHPEEGEKLRELFPRLLSRAEPWEYVFRLRGKNGEYRWFLSRATPQLDENGNIERWFGTNTDITQAKEAEDALKAADERKDRFLATLAHELRSPLAPLRNGLELLPLIKEDEQQIEKVHHMMQRQLAHMVHLIDDLMDLSRISREMIHLRREHVHLDHAAEQAMEAVQPIMKGFDHTFEHQIEGSLTVIGDPTRIAQVINNLLNNAAKYTPPGGRITLAIRRENDEAVIEVMDNGIGIPMEMIPRVFDMFAQVDTSQTTNGGGLGIGLHIVKKLVEMHGGTVSASSEGEGRGSTFVIRLPLAEGPIIADPVVIGNEAADLEELRVLVVDDNEDSAASMAAVLKALGQQSFVANDGAEAVVIAERERPHLIIMDIGMPGMNGYEACMRIREHEWGRKMKIVALTGWGLEQDRERSRQAGFDHHLVKPIDRGSLIDLLAGRSVVQLRGDRK